MNYGAPHTLVITRIPADEEHDEEVEYQIEHPKDCPTEKFVDEIDNPGQVVENYTCNTEFEISYCGIDFMAWKADVVPGWEKPTDPYDPDWKGLPEGRYVIRVWWYQDGWSGEYDGGLELLGLEGSVDIAA